MVNYENKIEVLKKIKLLGGIINDINKMLHTNSNLTEQEKISEKAIRVRVTSSKKNCEGSENEI